ncbi:MAG: hypothetical protein HRT47_06040 [Candidatus Caenarcaniphilales bacterium]|nr:hypothetical protein [Candidatus Caenarcaniphilales bacterium]
MLIKDLAFNSLLIANIATSNINKDQVQEINFKDLHKRCNIENCEKDTLKGFNINSFPYSYLLQLSAGLSLLKLFIMFQDKKIKMKKIKI